MKKIHSSIVILVTLSQLLFVYPTTVLAQDKQTDTKITYKELVGEYEFYIDKELLYLYFKLWEDKGVLMCKDQYRSNAMEITPIDLENLKFRIMRAGSEQFFQFFRDSTEEISSAKFIPTKKLEFFGTKLNKNAVSVSIADKLFSEEILKDELTQIKNILTRYHPAVYKFTSKKAFNKIYNEQIEKIDHPLNIREFYQVAAPLVELVGCGHTYMELPDKFWTGKNLNSFPIELRFIDNKAYVLSFYKEENKIPMGSEILSVNNIPMAEIINSAISIITSDGKNETWKFARLKSDFTDFFTILYGAHDSYKIEYIEPGTKDENVQVLSCIKPWQLIPNAKKTSSGDPNLDFELDKNRSIAIITIRDNNYYDGIEKFYSFIDSSFKKIYDFSIENVILDVRDNTGGDPVSAAHLLSYLEKEPIPYLKKIPRIKQYAYLAKPIPMTTKNAFKGNLFILINGGCFSTTAHLCSVLKYHDIGTFIGEETGGTYECNDASYAHHTKEARLNIIVAHMTFATAVKGIPREHGIMPDYTIKPKINDIIDGKDTVKEFTYSLIENNKGE